MKGSHKVWQSDMFKTTSQVSHTFKGKIKPGVKSFPELSIFDLLYCRCVHPQLSVQGGIITKNVDVFTRR